MFVEIGGLGSARIFPLLGDVFYFHLLFHRVGENRRKGPLVLANRLTCSDTAPPSDKPLPCFPPPLP